MFSKEDLHQHLKDLLKDVAPGDMAAITHKIGVHFQFAIDRYDDLSPEAKKLADDMGEKIKELNGQWINQLPDGKEKRKARRLHAATLGKFYDVEQLIKALETPPEQIDENLRECIRIFSDGLQDLTGFMFDITQHTGKGSAHFAQMGLLSMCVDELLVTQHLLKHRYVNQAYSHIRNIFEYLDKIELFRKQPQWADLWASGDENKIWNELRPAAVRIKLGKSKHDPIYGMFSSLGVHGTFRAVQVKTIRKKEDSVPGRPAFLFQIGGNRSEHNTVWVNAFSIYALYSVIFQLMRSFESSLNQEEGEEVLKRIFTELKEYSLKHFVVWAKKAGLNVGDFEEFLGEKTWDGMMRKAV